MAIRYLSDADKALLPLRGNHPTYWILRLVPFVHPEYYPSHLDGDKQNEE